MGARVGRAPRLPLLVLFVQRSALCYREGGSILDDETLMQQALEAAASVKGLTAPNPWVGAVLLLNDGAVTVGVTHPAGGPHAEIHALEQAGGAASGSTMFVTLEPCSHYGRTPPCVEAIVAAGVAKVVVAMIDPDPLVAGRGVQALREAGVEVQLGIGETEAQSLLAPYIHHRESGRPYVVLKMAASLDGGTAAPDYTSQWITSAVSRLDVHRLRAQSDAILVGAGTVRADDPALTVRGVESPLEGVSYKPLRVVLGSASNDRQVYPCLEMTGPLDKVLDDLGQRGVIQLLVEGGAHVAGEFHRSGLVNHYIIYLAPALFGGDDARPIMSGDGATTMDELWRGRILSAELIGDDVRIEFVPGDAKHYSTTLL